MIKNEKYKTHKFLMDSFNENNFTHSRESIIELIDLIINDFNNRNCNNCIFANYYSNYYRECKKGINLTANKDNNLVNIEFCCNKWESNNETNSN